MGTFTRTTAQIEGIHNTVDDPSSNQAFTDAIGEQVIPKYTDIVYKASGGNSAVENMIAGIPIKASVGDICSTGGTSWVVESVALPAGLSNFKALTKIKLADFNLIAGQNNLSKVQSAQDASEKSRQALDTRGVPLIDWDGILLIDNWLEWVGAGRFENTIKPQSILRSSIGGDSIIKKRDTSVDLKHFLMQDLGIDLGYTGPSSPTVDQLVSMIRLTANGSNDGDITYLRCHFHNPAHECTVHNVATTATGVSSGGKIDGVRMLFCSGDVEDLSLASRNANMFKTIHGSIDQPGAYGEYPITNVVSFGNTCRGMRTLSDFKRGTRHFNHDKCTVIDMTDVASISVDGAKDGVIGAYNTGHQTSQAANTKNFYEIQGEDVEVLNGSWDCDNQAGAVAAVLVTDYAYPAETTGSYNANQSINVNVHGFTAKNVPFHAVRLINTKDCDVRGVKAKSCTLDGVSFEMASGKLDLDGNPVIPSNNSVDRVNTTSCRFSASALDGNDVSIGSEIYDENGVYNIQLIGIANQPYRASFVAEELNINPRAENYGTGLPLRWSGSATATVSTVSPPNDSVIKLVLEDINPAAIQTYGPSTKITISQNQALYFSVVCRLETSPSCSILVQEFTALDAFVSSSFIPLGATANFELRQRKFLITNATTAYAVISLVPAGDSGASSSLVGISEFANFKISNKLT